MIINANNKSIRYTGRWNVSSASAETTANGSYFEFTYYGECAVISFDISTCKIPFPHIYISVDDGANIETAIDKFIRITAKKGKHYVKVIMKSSVESQERWYEPIEAIIRLNKIEADDFFELDIDNRKVIEFVGDSITEGVSIDVLNELNETYVNYGDISDMVYWDDSTAGYAWKVSELLNLKPVFMGYGCLGITKDGSGNVPAAYQSYPYYSNMAEIKKYTADIIVINHGTNDCGTEKEVFLEKYTKLLNIVRNKNPKAKIFSVTPFSGINADNIKLCVEAFNEEFNDDVFYVNSTGWISPKPIHPSRAGHKIVAEKLAEIIKKNI